MAINPLTDEKEISIDEILKKERNGRLNKNSIALIISVIILLSFGNLACLMGIAYLRGYPQ